LKDVLDFDKNKISKVEWSDTKKAQQSLFILTIKQKNYKISLRTIKEDSYE
jgi:hypothetical protein